MRLSYVVVHTAGLEEFQKTVRAHTDVGYEPAPGFQMVAVYSRSGQNEFYQALWLPPKSDVPKKGFTREA